jgi:RNA-directed DNA polymerase
MKRRHPEKSSKWLIKKYFNHPKRKWGFCCRTKDRDGVERLLELVKPSYTKIVRYIKIKGESNPFDPRFKDYFAMRRTFSNVRPISNN